MGRTIYASFADTSDAEKAAGALLDHGVKSEDISLVQSGDEETYNARSRADYGRTGWDSGNDAIDAADAGIAGTKAAGNTAAEWGDRAAGGIADAVGAEGTAAGFRGAAEERDAIADQHAARASGEMRESLDMDDYSSTSNISSESNTGVNRVTADYDENDVNRGVTTDLDDANMNRGSSTGGFLGGDVNRDPDADADSDLSAKKGISTTTPADAGSGAVKGAAVGVGVGVVAALASLFVPGFGIVTGAGALAAALGGVAASTGAGAAAGALTGYLKDQGVDEDVAASYSQTISAGGAMLAVTVPSGDCDEDEATRVLAKYGATNVNAY
jgi:hypothetical protein